MGRGLVSSSSIASSAAHNASTVLVTIHPSALLRIRAVADKAKAFAGLARDLRMCVPYVRKKAV